MPATFAVIDLGSNAIRLQMASVDQPGTYKITQQERRPVRLGHKVFETGALDPKSREEGLDTLQKFKALADRQEVTSMRAVATSALREASDGASFIRAAKKAGVPLEILSEEDEARLIGLGIRSGLKFDPAVGLFMDIGGGSVEIALGDRSNMSFLYSLPLGAVRLTERFIRHDPPHDREIAGLEDFALEKLGPITRRIEREKFTMAFGSGGTMTTLADTDVRLSGEAQRESLYVLRRTRLNSLFELLRSQNLKQRTAAIAGDPKRAEILIAGSCVLLAMMKSMDLDYLFVSRRGLRDGLMVDLLARNCPGYAGPWVEDVARSETLEEVGEKYNYDAAHSQHVSRLALSMFEQLRDLHNLPNRYSEILHAAAMLHDIGLFIAYPKHHKHSYYLVKSSGPSSFDPAELDLIANIARYHRRSHPQPGHLPFSQLSQTQQDVVRKLSAILRIADGLDFGHQAKVQKVKCTISKSKVLSIKVTGSAGLSEEIESAKAKSDLMNKVYGLKTVFS